MRSVKDLTLGSQGGVNWASNPALCTRIKAVPLAPQREPAVKLAVYSGDREGSREVRGAQDPIWN